MTIPYSRRIEYFRKYRQDHKAQNREAVKRCRIKKYIAYKSKAIK